ncbi:hypothetical protein [Streptacidiphilus fuscans]|uniref:Serine protease n=1 Tax=Streptacidiphilus fuscans TaxID=2789292 RepID=A0A931FCZ1_9ACTN|nr:hypothetical protein [Streptacidiphilus fuscans]MBF9069003.1 hypothetical protein [Streptacidiphilus fuscans]
MNPSPSRPRGRRVRAVLGVAVAAALLPASQLLAAPHASAAPAASAAPGASQSHGADTAARSADGGVVHFVRSHGHLVRVVTHGRYGIVAADGTSAVPARRRANSGGLQYNGGVVQHSPRVYLVYWGSQWDNDSNGIQPYMTNLFNGIGTSSDSWSATTTQYPDSSGTGPSFTGPVLAGSWVDDSAPAPAAAQQADIAAEADAAASHFGVAGDPDAQIVVMSPHGTSPDGWPSSGFCAWHDYTGSVSYSNMPYQLDAPSGSRCPNAALGGKLDAFSIVEGHEFAESVTDPQPSSGWVDANGEEIGDLCESNFQDVTLSTGTFAMQPLWSNNDGGCVITPGSGTGSATAR